MTSSRVGSERRAIYRPGGGGHFDGRAGMGREGGKERERERDEVEREREVGRWVGEEKTGGEGKWECKVQTSMQADNRI